MRCAAHMPDKKHREENIGPNHALGDQACVDEPHERCKSRH